MSTLQDLLGALLGANGPQKDQDIERVKQLPPEEQVNFVMESVGLMANRGTAYPGAGRPLSAVLRKKLPFTPEQIQRLVEWGENPSYYYPFLPVLSLAESIPMTPELAGALRKMRSCKVIATGFVSGHLGIVRRIDEILNAADGPRPFEPAGAWSRYIAAEITPLWQKVLEAGRDISGGEPSKKWRDASAARVCEIGRDTFRATALRWLSLGPSPETPGVQIDAKESDYQRGLLWCLADFCDPETCVTVARFAEASLHKIPMLGAVSQKAGNACVNVLGAMQSRDAVAQLARLAVRIKYHTAQRLVEEALNDAAQRQGISRDELAEITVPDFGLDSEGRRKEHLGDCYVELSASGELTYEDAAGKRLKAAPEAAKRDFAEELNQLKQAGKEIAVMRSAHRTRIERLLLSQRAIPVDTWRTAYVGHPLLANLARTLIWQFDTGATAIWRDGRMMDWSGAEVRQEGSVRLWHPLNSDVQTVLSWRCWLEDHEVRQPFKQAHREVYIVTDAERATRDHSNRFAGHILKQHQFHALCEQRGWNFRLMGQWDSHNTPYVDLPEQGLRAEYHVDFPRDPSASGHAVYLYLATDRVRFADLKTGAAVEIHSVPPLLFSEVMRDIDLFVGVASIGADPAWGAKEDAPFAHYWKEFAYGDLTASAIQRKELLERLLPKLPIRDRCRIEDRYLWVRGDRAQYKIHLGSSTVLIEPGTRYLCIVRGPAAGAPDKVFLPFEGDSMLSLILSKAFLLAADKKITDPAIVRQLP
jgi:hypothetical protein